MTDEEIKAGFEKLQYKEGDILILYLGDLEKMQFPVMDTLTIYKEKMKPYLAELGIPENKVIITYPFVKFELLKDLKEDDCLVVTLGDKEKNLFPLKGEVDWYRDYLKKVGIKSKLLVLEPLAEATKGKELEVKDGN